ncbi:MAG: hypothetical protein Q9157_003015 [Trypethelium eluteriae]
MRGAGCTINDLWDRNLDPHVARTRLRPIARGAISPQTAIIFTGFQLLAGLGVLVSFPPACFFYGAPSLLLVATYPLAKRVTYYPQFVLGLTFSWGAFMGFPALGLDLLSDANLMLAAGALYASNVAWTVLYDMIYAHMDIRDDATAGIKSIALRHERNTKAVLSGLAAVQVGLLGLAGWTIGAGPVYYILFARMFITLILSSSYMWCMKTPYFPLGMKEVRWLLVLRGIGGFFGVFGMYYSLLYLPLADATVITFLAPGLACWACSILIKEPYTRIEQIGGLISIVGVVLIAHPTSLFSSNSSNISPSASGSADGPAAVNGTKIAPPTAPDASSYADVTPSQRLGAVGIALIGVIGAATAYTTIRWIGKRAHPLISVNYFAAWCTVVSITMMLALPGVGFLVPSGLKDWAYLIFLGTCGFIMQFLLAAGLSYEKSSRATNMTYTQMLFALAFDKLVFGTTPGLTSIIGSSLILGSAIYVALQKDAATKKEEGNGQGYTGDEEEARGLVEMSLENDDRENEIRNVEEVQMRTLR